MHDLSSFQPIRMHASKRSIRFSASLVSLVSLKWTSRRLCVVHVSFLFNFPSSFSPPAELLQQPQLRLVMNFRFLFRASFLFARSFDALALSPSGTTTLPLEFWSFYPLETVQLSDLDGVRAVQRVDWDG